jgi:hypothetical protein
MYAPQGSDDGRVLFDFCIRLVEPLLLAQFLIYDGQDYQITERIAHRLVYDIVNHSCQPSLL